MGAMPSREMLFNLLKRPTSDGAEAAFQYEVAEEQAAALGRMGRKAEAALAALRDHDAQGLGEGRAEVLKKAADAVWCFLVQREVMGLRDRAQIVADYQISREVMVRLGIR
jgi:hypothetical protein